MQTRRPPGSGRRGHAPRSAASAGGALDRLRPPHRSHATKRRATRQIVGRRQCPGAAQNGTYVCAHEGVSLATSDSRFWRRPRQARPVDLVGPGVAVTMDEGAPERTIWARVSLSRPRVRCEGPDTADSTPRVAALARRNLAPFAELNADPDVMAHMQKTMSREESDAFVRTSRRSSTTAVSVCGPWRRRTTRRSLALWGCTGAV